MPTKRLLYILPAGTIAIAIAIAAVAAFGFYEPQIDPIADFDIQRDAVIAGEIVKKHFTDESYGTFYIDNEADKYVFIMDREDAAAQKLIQELKEAFGAHVEFVPSQIPYKQLMALNDKIAQDGDFDPYKFEVSADIIEQQVKVRANFDERMKQTFVERYGTEFVALEHYDPGAAAPEDGKYPEDWPLPAQQIGSEEASKEAEAGSINAKLETDQKQYTPDSTIEMILTNWGPSGLEFGSSFELQRFENGNWKLLGGSSSSTAELIGVNAGSEYKRTIAIKAFRLQPGQYRLLKHVGQSDGSTGNPAKSAVLAAPFEIVSRP